MGSGHSWVSGQGCLQPPMEGGHGQALRQHLVAVSPRAPLTVKNSLRRPEWRLEWILDLSVCTQELLSSLFSQRAPWEAEQGPEGSLEPTFIPSQLTALRIQLSKPRRGAGMYSHQTWQMENHSNLHAAFWAAQEQQEQR